MSVKLISALSALAIAFISAIFYLGMQLGGIQQSIRGLEQRMVGVEQRLENIENHLRGTVEVVASNSNGDNRGILKTDSKLQ